MEKLWRHLKRRRLEGTQRLHRPQVAARHGQVDASGPQRGCLGQHSLHHVSAESQRHIQRFGGDVFNWERAQEAESPRGIRALEQLLHITRDGFGAPALGARVLAGTQPRAATGAFATARHFAFATEVYSGLARGRHRLPT